MPPENPRKSPGLIHSSGSGLILKYPALAISTSIFLSDSNEENLSKMESLASLKSLIFSTFCWAGVRACCRAEEIIIFTFNYFDIDDWSVSVAHLQDLIVRSRRVSALHSYSMPKIWFVSKLEYFNLRTQRDPIRSYFPPRLQVPLYICKHVSE